MSKHTYRPVKGTGGSLFTRLATDEVNNTAEFSQHILDFVRDKISEQDLAQLKKMLMGEDAGDEDAPIKGVEARGAQDSASFNKKFPGAARIGRDPYPGGFR